jgi:outer membrane protein assembly factor BamB
MNILTPTVVGDRVFTSSYGGRSILLSVEKAAAGFTVKELWTNRSQAYMSSPVIVGQHAYLHLRNQRVCCLDLRNGRTNWTSKPFGKYWSMVTNGQQILSLDERGELVLLEVNPTKLKVLSRRPVSRQEAWAHLAVCGDEVFVRDLRGLTVFQWRKNATKLSDSRSTTRQ